MYNTDGFSNKDKKVLRENEGKTPHEMLMAGLSDKGYQRLLEQEQTEKAAPTVQAAPVEDTPIQPAKVEKVHQPKVMPLTPNTPEGTLIVQGPTGVAKPVNAKQARAIVQQDPENYKIVG